MVVVDAAILRWLVQVIQNNREGHLIELDSPVVQALCALTTPDELFASDVLTVLGEVERNIDSYSLERLSFLYPSLLTVITMLSPSLARTKVEGIVANLYRKNIEIYGPQCRIILGTEHEFVEAMEKNVPEEVIGRWNFQVDHSGKVHSLSGGKIEHEKLPDFSLRICPNNTLVVKYGGVSKGVTKWNMRYDINTSSIRIGEHPEEELSYRNHCCPLVVCMIQPPAIFWDKITSCTSLKMLHELIKSPEMRRMILTYGVSILEGKFRYRSNTIPVKFN